METRLVGRSVPDVQLQYAYEAFASITALARRASLVIFFYPGSEKTTTPQEGEAASADERRAEAWSRCEPELTKMGYELMGVSAQSAIEQARFASLDPLPYVLLSDPGLKLAELLGIPATGPRMERVYEPLTIVVRNERIVRVFYPIELASETRLVMSWIRDNAVQ